MVAEGVHRAVLDNGLVVLLKESHRAPVGSFWVWYRVGSRDEHPGRTGLSHWVEHMMFRGTERYPRGLPDRLIGRVGGYHNAMTYLDWTAYFQTLPADHLGLAVDIEADRMSHVRFTAEDTERERTVILSERQGMEGSPLFLLQEAVLAAAFTVHPYGHPVIGRLADLRTLGRDDLLQHMAAFYAPDNAVVVVVGDFEWREMLSRVEAAFGPLPAGVARPVAAVAEPSQRSERRVQIGGPDDTAYLMAVFHAPPATHPDFFPLAVADALLGGARPMGVFDEGGANRTARLYRALVDTDLAADVGSYLMPTVDPYLFTCLVTARSDRRLQDVEPALLAELDRLAREPVTAEELRRAVHQTRAQFAFSIESVTDQAYWLGFAEVVADLPWLNGFLDALAAVTAEDVQRVAQTYFTAANRTVGWYVPEKGSA